MAINLYPATLNMPQLTIVVIDTIPVELKRSVYGLELVCVCSGCQPAAGDPSPVGCRVVEPPPIESLAKEVRELEEHHREKLNPETTRELTSLVRNLNRLLKANANAMTNIARRSPTLRTA